MNRTPRRLIAEDDSRRFLSREECDALARRIATFADGGETQVRIDSWWSGELRWGRNRVMLAADRRESRVGITRALHGARASVQTNQIDDASLAAAVRAAERALRYVPTAATDLVVPPPRFVYATPTIWSDRTFDLDAAERGRIARAMIEPAEAAGMLAAGYLEVKATGWANILPWGASLYAPETRAQCSMTVRDPAGTGSGWAGQSSYDWAAIDPEAIATRALEKCLASRNPVAIEPGRYTVILEPQATGDLVRYVVGALDRAKAEQSDTPFTAGPDQSRLGLRIVDPRVSIGHDPMDPQLGVVPFDPSGEPYRPVAWIDHGVLTALAYDRAYALHRLGDNLGVPNSGSFRMSGGEATVDEMIRTTRRGLLVTRFSNIHVIDPKSLLLSGVTRDGLWLIENGKISRAVKNLRFTESPLFVLNSLVEMGPPVPIFSPGTPIVVPPIKANDFSFTSTIDAI
jgi:predicted Zn-dependent protease